MPAGGRTIEEIAELRERVVRLVLSGDSPTEAARAVGISDRHAHRALKRWRDHRGMTAQQLREMQLAARSARSAERTGA
jgi:transposase-like protein